MAPETASRPRRERKTRRGVHVAEQAARTLITVGGIGTIVSVSAICLFLIWVVAPLFVGAEVEAGGPPIEAVPGAEPVVASGVDEYRLMTWSLHRDGTLVARRLDQGEVLERSRLFGDERPTAFSFDSISGTVSVGFAAGQVRLVELGFTTRYLVEEPEALEGLAVGEVARLDTEMVQRTPEGQLRAQSLYVKVDEPVSLGSTDVVLIDHTESSSGTVFCALTSDDKLALYGVRRIENLLTGEITVKLREGLVPYEPRDDGAAPMRLALSGNGDAVFLTWQDGGFQRFDARDFRSPQLAETLDLVEEPGEEVTAIGMLAGKNTLLVGDSTGRVRGWFRTKPEGAETVDGAVLVVGHELDVGGVPTAFVPSARSRLFGVGTDSGDAAIYYMTNERRIAQLATAGGGGVQSLALAPREDAVVVHAAGGAASWRLDPGYPEVSLRGLFGRVWYESYPEPEHVWQSSSGTDDFEPKLGLMPLIFGTLKATFYSMLFGAPLALMAAVYSSEFLDPRIRVGVKSTIEIMASLPSVVLGFLAALVIAPFVQGVLPAILALFLMVPLSWLFGAYLWQLLPQQYVVRFSGWPRFLTIVVTLVPGVLVSGPVGGLLERALFGGDLEGWLAGSEGSAAGGWLILLGPLCTVLALFACGRLLGPWIRRLTSSWDRRQCALFDLGRFLATIVAGLVVAGVLSSLLAAAGYDARGSYLDTYVQRNALVVGFVMGFAVIPIIYTIAEDALSSVPSHLRLASLGAGATPWQTAVRVIIPTAMSGLFSALMVGLGRAVGETMIVLMATGNTPVMDWNVFNGFRTLSANIAVELPEAVRNSTHYRTLFLAALCLFAMTFVVNTVAEVVRQRFRKRAFQL